MGAFYLLGFHVIRSCDSGHARGVCYKKHWFDYFRALPSLWASVLSSCLLGQHHQPPGALLAYLAYGIQNGRGNFFWRLNSIPVCIDHILFTHSFVDSLLGCFHHWTIRSNAWALLLLSASPWYLYDKMTAGRQVLLRMWKKQNLLLVRMQNGTTTFKNSFAILKKFSIYLLYDLVISFLSKY